MPRPHGTSRSFRPPGTRGPLILRAFEKLSTGNRYFWQGSVNTPLLTPGWKVLYRIVSYRQAIAHSKCTLFRDADGDVINAHMPSLQHSR